MNLLTIITVLYLLINCVLSLSVRHAYREADGSDTGANIVGNRRQIVINVGNGANGGKGGDGGAGYIRHRGKVSKHESLTDDITQQNVKTGYKQIWIHDRYHINGRNGDDGVAPDDSVDANRGKNGMNGKDGADGQSFVYYSRN